MKALPCSTVGCGGHDQMKGAAVLRDGSPYLVGKAPADFPHRVFCAKCKRTTIISRMDWNRLPSVKQEEIDSVAPPDDRSHKDFKAMTNKVQES